METLKLHPQYVVDSKGRRRQVVLTFSEYREILECLQDVIDLELIDEVRDEPTVPWEKVQAKRRSSHRGK